MSLGRPELGRVQIIEYMGEDDGLDIEPGDLLSDPDWTGAKTAPDNSKEWWIFYRIENETPEGKWALALGWAREIEPPWRRGAGIAVRRGPITVSYGAWFRGKAPKEITEDFAATVEEIATW